jgi:hypothetical protein
VADGISTLLRLLSRIACLIVLASFTWFAVEQAGSASAHQQQELNASAPASTAASPTKSSAKATGKTESSLRKAIDEASSAITSPFSAATAGWKNEWAIHGTLTLLALLIYGFGLGFLARVLRVRV